MSKNEMIKRVFEIRKLAQDKGEYIGVELEIEYLNILDKLKENYGLSWGSRQLEWTYYNEYLKGVFNNE